MHVHIYKHAAKRIYVHNTVFLRCSTYRTVFGKKQNAAEDDCVDVRFVTRRGEVSDSGPKNGGHSRAGRVNGRTFGRAVAVRLPRFGGGTSVFGQPIYWFAPVPHPTAADATVGRTVVRAVLLKPDFLQYCI